MALLPMKSRGQRDKFTQLYETYRYTMLHVAASILKDQAEAEDVVHDAFLKIMEVMDQIGDVNCSKTRGLIVIIVKNKAIDRFRREKRVEQHPLEDYAYTLSDEGDGPVDLVIGKQGYERLLAAISSLGEKYRSVLELKYIYGYGNAEIARILDIEQKTLNMRIYRAKGMLRQILEGGEDVAGNQTGKRTLSDDSHSGVKRGE